MYKFFLNDGFQGLTEVFPKGFQDSMVSLDRHPEYHGVFKSWTIGLSFPCKDGGGEYIRTAYLSQGVNANISILIEYDCDQTGFEPFFEGKLKMKTYRVSNEAGDSEVFVEIESSSFTEKFFSRDEVEIDLANPVGIDGNFILAATSNFWDYFITMRGQTIDYRSEWENQQDDIELASDFVLPLSVSRIIRQTPSLVATLAELKASSNQSSRFFYGATDTNQNTIGDINIHTTVGQSPNIWPAIYHISFWFEGWFHDTPSNPAATRICSDMNLIFAYGKDIGSATQITLGTFAGYSTAGPVTTGFNFSAGFTLGVGINPPVNPGDRFWLFWGSSGTGYVFTAGGATESSELRFEYLRGEFDAFVESQVPETNCKGFAIYEAIETVVASMTGINYAIRSSYFGREASVPFSYPVDGCGSQTALLSGFALRGFTNQEYPALTTWRNMFRALDSIWSVGCGIGVDATGEHLRVEPKRYFYDSETLLFTLYPAKVEKTVSEKLLPNSIKIGFQKWQPYSTQGLDSICTSRQYATGVIPIKQELDKLCPYICEGYLIEDVRRTGIGTVDTANDKDIFLVALWQRNPGDFLYMTDSEQDNDFNSVSGILHPDARYNLRFSVARNLIRQNEELAVWLYGDLQVTGSEGNMNLESDLISTCPGEYQGNLVDSADVDLKDSGINGEKKLFKPEFCSFDHPLTAKQYKLMESLPYGMIGFIDPNDGQSKFGFILSAKYSPHNHNANFLLLQA